MAGVIAIIFVVDVITTCVTCCSIRRWQMLLPGGRWNSTCIGTAITQFPQSIVWLGHSIIEQSPYVPTVVTQEEEYLSKALMDCKYSIWALNRVKMKMRKPAQKKNSNKSTTLQNTNQKPHITVPYYKRLSKSVKKKCNNYGVQVYFRGGTTIKNLLMAPKDKDPMLKKSGVIYSYK